MDVGTATTLHCPTCKLWFNTQLTWLIHAQAHAERGDVFAELRLCENCQLPSTCMIAKYCNVCGFVELTLRCDTSEIVAATMVEDKIAEHLAGKGRI